MQKQRKNARGSCSRKGCTAPHQAKGLCANHYHQERNKRVRLEAKEGRRCTWCGDLVPAERKRHGPISYCSRQCKEKAWVKSPRSREVQLKSYFKRRYGLTPEQVEEMAQGGCAICGTTTWPGRHSRPHVDHDHVTGKVRGILCSECNTGLGKFKDDPDSLRAAADYLEK